MAQPGQALCYVCRTCRSQWPNSMKGASSRLFSSTHQRSKTIPSFAPTANPQLDELFADVRQRIFLPAALSPQHQSLIYRRRHDELLNKDPGIIVTMDDGEEIRLRPTDRFDKPKGKEIFRQVLSNLDDSSSTWDSLLPFLQGMVMSKTPKVPSSFYETLIRKAAEVGREGILIDYARSAAQTGFKLSKPRLARTLFLSFHRQAAAGKFQGTKLETAWKRAQYVARMLETEDHLPEPGDVDPRSDPLILATLLELCAHTALKELPDDLQRMVASYAKRLAHLIQDGSPSLPMDKKEPAKYTEREKLASISYDLETEAIMRHAIDVALKVRSVERADTVILKEHLRVLNQSIAEKVTVLRADTGATDRPRRSLEIHDQLRSLK